MINPFRIDIRRTSWMTYETGSPVPAGAPRSVARVGAAASRPATCGSSPPTGADGYDWRKHEARLNDLPQFTTISMDRPSTSRIFALSRPRPPR
ncbi:epoxide hydrolase N-terminal domain-containing protein [Nonomuraea dietziae]|uniref:epoxide hydrolase N-terminal domain-containing protein n=1 Tax=Nonomuraea dietziae TaxID=65515 RepID=UPI00337C5FFB